MKRIWKRTGVIFWFFMMCFLTGCGKRELEDREFPSVIAAWDGELAEAQKKRQSQSGLYLDYGHVKAVILKREAALEETSRREILSYLEERPAFARNVLMFAGTEEALEAAENQQEDMGAFLEDLYKNQPKETRQESVTLQEVLNFWHNKEESLPLPFLEMKEGDVILAGTVTLENEAVETLCAPVWSKVTVQPSG